MKNGKYVLNYQHVCYNASGCASPYVSFTFILLGAAFITGQKAGQELNDFFLNNMNTKKEQEREGGTGGGHIDSVVILRFLFFF